MTPPLSKIPRDSIEHWVFATSFLFATLALNSLFRRHKHCPGVVPATQEDPGGLPRFGGDQKGVRIFQAVDSHRANWQLKCPYFTGCHADRPDVQIGRASCRERA